MDGALVIIAFAAIFVIIVAIAINFRCGRGGGGGDDESVERVMPEKFFREDPNNPHLDREYSLGVKLSPTELHCELRMLLQEFDVMTTEKGVGVLARSRVRAGCLPQSGYHSVGRRHRRVYDGGGAYEVTGT